jgi:hypothetical protein
MRADLERNHFGKFVVIHDSELVGAFDSFENAAREALRRFGGDETYLIRQVGSDEPKLSPAIVYGLRGRVDLPYGVQCQV